MDWLADKWNAILQSYVWKSFFAQFAWIDWVLAIAILYGILWGLKKGFWDMVSAHFKLLFTILLTFEFSERLVQYPKKIFVFVPEHLWPFLGFVLTALIAWLVVGFVIQIVTSIFTAKSSESLHVLGGLLLGTVYIFIVLSFFTQMLLLSPWQEGKAVFEKGQSLSGYYLDQTTPVMYEKISKPVHALVKGFQQ